MIEAIIVLMVFGVGYAAGRRIGRQQGEQLGWVQAVIDLRIKALEQGRCPLCGFAVESEKNEVDAV